MASRVLVATDVFYEILSQYEYNFARVPRFDYASVKPGSIIDPLYGKVELDKSICYLLAFPIVDRLREAKQLGMTDLVYTGATHTRLEHSLGVSYLLGKLPKDVDDQGRSILRIIGLLHDIGHSGWGHALDGITSKVVTEVQRVAGPETYLFSPKKLDMVVTSYLLYHNDQLTEALEEISKSLPTWGELALATYPERLRDFIAWVISEEESGHLCYCHNWVSEADRLADLAHYFQDLLGFGVNSDRLDWIERDAHHAFCSVDLGHKAKVEELSEARKKLRVTQSKSTPGKAEADDKSVWAQLQRSQGEIRELLYTKVYEGPERSFIDSLITRLVYSSILVLSAIGNQVAGPSAKARVIMGYIFSPDSRLRYYAEKILSASYYSYPFLPPVRDDFVRNSYRLWVSLFENLRMVLSLLGNKSNPVSPPLTLMKIAGELIVDGRKYTIAYLDGFWLSEVITMEGMYLKFARGESSLKIAWHALNEFLGHLRTDTIGVFGTEEIEKRICASPETRGKVRVYLLPNYYFLRKIMDNMPRFIKEYGGGDSIFTKFVEELQKEYAERPLVFIVFEDEVETELKTEIVKHVEELLTSHLAHLLGDKLAVSLSTSGA